jgi:pyruvate dehydrogenase E1 component beta subunit
MTGANIGSTTYVEAILAAQRKILMEKSNSLVLGINVTSPSAIFGSVKGLYEEFGDKRVIETPSSENAVTGIALGLATSGHIPILVHQRLDFAILSLDMLINQLAKWRFMYGDNLSAPVIVRMIVGRGWGQGPQHSQALHNLFMHVPGFRVFSPSSPQDIYSSLLEAATSCSPTIFIEHRWLYETIGQIDHDQVTLPNLTRSHSVSKNSLVTIVTISFSTLEVLRAKNILETKSVDIDVFEVVRLDKLDLDSILQSVAKTGALIITDIGHEFAGAGSAILAELTKRGAKFKKPPVVLGLPNYPTPTSPSLAASYYPSCLEILQAVVQISSIKISFDDPDYGLMSDVPGNRFIGYY